MGARFGKKAYTVTEIMIAFAVFGVVLAFVNSFLASGFRTSQAGSKMLAAIQDSALILHNIRSDLRTHVEFAGQPESFIRFDAAAKKLEFMVINGVNEVGMPVFSTVSYALEKGMIVKKFYLMKDDDTLGAQTTKYITQKNRIKDFEIQIFSRDAKPVSSSPAAREKDPPQYVKVKLVHATNERFDFDVGLYSTYMSEPNPLDKYWLPGYKVIPVAAVFKMNIGVGQLSFAVDSNPNASVLNYGIHIGKNMGVMMAPASEIADFSITAVAAAEEAKKAKEGEGGQGGAQGGQGGQGQGGAQGGPGGPGGGPPPPPPPPQKGPGQ